MKIARNAVRVLVAIGILLGFWLFFRIGNWTGTRISLPKIPRVIPVVVEGEDKSEGYPSKPNIVYRFLHSESVPDTKYIYVATPRMRDAVDITRSAYRNGRLEIDYIKDDSLGETDVHHNVPPNHTLYATEDSVVVEFDRFRFDWFDWNGIELGGKIWLNGEIEPRIKTGFGISRSDLSIGIGIQDGKIAFFGDIAFTIF